MTDKDLDTLIRRVVDFPKKGILFYDITSLLAKPEAFHYIIDRMVELYKDKNIEAVAGVEARGFIFAAPFAYRMNIPFIPIRKAGKLPGITLKTSYQLEYGRAEIEIHGEDVPRGKNVLLIDDLLATGGTLAASAKLLEQGGAIVNDIFGAVGLTFLPYKEKLNQYTVTTLLEYDNEKV